MFITMGEHKFLVDPQDLIMGVEKTKQTPSYTKQKVILMQKVKEEVQSDTGTNTILQNNMRELRV